MLDSQKGQTYFHVTWDDSSSASISFGGKMGFLTDMCVERVKDWY